MAKTISEGHNECIQALEDILDECEGHEDVIDGPDGQPRPDRIMRVVMIAKRALGEMEG
jgi:hypothetical protein